MPVVNSAPPYLYVENDRIVGGDPDDPLAYVGRGGKATTPITPIPPEAAQRSGNMFSGAIEAHKLFNKTGFPKAREIMGKHLSKDEGLWIAYQSNVAMLLFDRYGIKDPMKRCQAASEILELIFSIPPRLHQKEIDEFAKDVGKGKPLKGGFEWFWAKANREKP